VVSHGPVGASKLARVINDDAGHLTPRGVLAMVVNEDAGCLTPRGVLGCIASMLAPTEDKFCRDVDVWSATDL